MNFKHRTSIALKSESTHCSSSLLTPLAIFFKIVFVVCCQLLGNRIPEIPVVLHNTIFLQPRRQSRVEWTLLHGRARPARVEQENRSVVVVLPNTSTYRLVRSAHRLLLVPVVATQWLVLRSELTLKILLTSSRLRLFRLRRLKVRLSATE